MTRYIKHSAVFLIIIMITGASCRKIKQYNTPLELEPLQQGLKVSMAAGYCAAVAASVFEQGILPSNVEYVQGNTAGYSKSGIIYLHIDSDHPLPFNSNVGDVVIAGLWDGTGGVISILFANIDIISGVYKLYGLQTVPVVRREDGRLMTVFAQEDILLTSGADTILNISLTNPQFNLELDRTNDPMPENVNIAIQQNVWFTVVDQMSTFDNVYDDDYLMSGGGQIAEVQSSSGGVMYHAMIDTKVNYASCAKNPLSGTAFVQNVKAGGSFVDLGNFMLSFHDVCDGQAHVDVALGKYLKYNGKYAGLGL